jgi:hypothetical protein
MPLLKRLRREWFLYPKSYRQINRITISMAHPRERKDARGHAPLLTCKLAGLSGTLWIARFHTVSKSAEPMRSLGATVSFQRFFKWSPNVLDSTSCTAINRIVCKAPSKNHALPQRPWCR